MTDLIRDRGTEGATGMTRRFIPPRPQPGASGPVEPIDLRAVAMATLHRWWIVVPIVVIAGLIGYQASSALPTVYESKATLIVGQTTGGAGTEMNDIQAAERLAFVYADLAKRQPTMMAVVEALELDMSWGALADQVSIKRVADTPLIEITVEATTAEQAEAIATELNRQIIALSPGEQALDAQRFIQDQIAAVRGDIEREQRALERLRERRAAGTLGLSGDIEESQARLASLRAEHSSLLEDLRSDPRTNAISVFQEPAAATQQVQVNKAMNALLAAAVGFLMGVALSMVLESRSRRPRPRAKS